MSVDQGMHDIYTPTGTVTTVLQLFTPLISVTKLLIVVSPGYRFTKAVFLVFFQRVHSFFSSPPQRPMTSDFDGFSIPDFIHYIYFPILILEKEPVFPFSMFSATQGNHWYHFYNVFGMTRSLTGDCTRDLPHSKPALYHQVIEETVLKQLNISVNFGS